MQIMKIGSKDFILSISQEYPSLIIFRKSGSENDKKVKEIQKKIDVLKDTMPKVNIYEYLTDENTENQLLVDMIEVPESISVILFKNGCFSRYQLNPHQKQNLKKIWGFAKSKGKNLVEKEGMEEQI